MQLWMHQMSRQVSAGMENFNSFIGGKADIGTVKVLQGKMKAVSFEKEELLADC